MGSEKSEKTGISPAGADDQIERTKTEDGMDEKVTVEDRDYAGAVTKLSPEEVRLVRKLDWRIMVSYCPNDDSGCFRKLTQKCSRP